MSSLPSVTVVSLLLAACGGASMPDGGTVIDATAAPDVGLPPDATVAPDVGLPPDAATPFSPPEPVPLDGGGDDFGGYCAVNPPDGGALAICHVGGATWRCFNTTCTNDCDAVRRSPQGCGQAFTPSCTCPHGLCWNGASCEAIGALIDAGIF